MLLYSKTVYGLVFVLSVIFLQLKEVNLDCNMTFCKFLPRCCIWTLQKEVHCKRWHCKYGITNMALQIWHCKYDIANILCLLPPFRQSYYKNNKITWISPRLSKERIEENYFGEAKARPLPRGKVRSRADFQP